MKFLPSLLALLPALFGFSPLHADSPDAPPREILSLDSCRSRALQHNKQLQVARWAVERARHEHAAARTNYLPKISATAAYTHTGETLSLLSDRQKSELTHLGTNLSRSLSPQFQQAAQRLLAAQPALAPLVQSVMAAAPGAASALDAAGRRLADAFDTDTRDVAVGAIVLTQPLYMGGKIRAYDRLTRYSSQLSGEQLRAEEQALVLEVDKAYWQVVSLVNKQALAQSYCDMLRHLHGDLEKMIAQGVATRSGELSVSVELNRAEMALLKVTDGLTLSRMLLAQLCGMPLDARPALADEPLSDLPVATQPASPDAALAFALRPELRQLDLAARIYSEKTRIERAAHRPTLALTAGVLTHYPTLHDGFQRRFHGTWNVGLLLRMPLWTWGEARHKVSAARAEEAMSRLRLSDARDRIELQVHQSAFAVNEANKKLALAGKNLDKAEENLRMARVGFDEGVLPTSDLLAAHTAWLAAHSDKIDAQIDVRLTRAAHRKALGQ